MEINESIPEKLWEDFKEKLKDFSPSLDEKAEKLLKVYYDLGECKIALGEPSWSTTKVQLLNKKNWDHIKKYIRTNRIDWDQLVDQTNGLVHYLAYHRQSSLIKKINPIWLAECRYFKEAVGNKTTLLLGQRSPKREGPNRIPPITSPTTSGCFNLRMNRAQTRVTMMITRA